MGRRELCAQGGAVPPSLREKRERVKIYKGRFSYFFFFFLLFLLILFCVSVTLKERTVGDRKKANDMGANPETHTRWEKIKEGGGTDRSNTRQQKKREARSLSVCQDCQAISSVSPAAPTDADAIFPLLIFSSSSSIDFKKTLDFF